jgi:hypothetical protein
VRSASYRAVCRPDCHVEAFSDYVNDTIGEPSRLDGFADATPRTTEALVRTTAVRMSREVIP